MSTASTLDTIVAPASAIGGGVVVLRVSGPMATTICRKLLQAPLQAPRIAQLAALKHPVSGKLLDRALVLYFQNPASFTGEDVIEFHLHGGRAVVQSVIQAVLSIDTSVRMAQPGEFSRRAYLNGKLDLTEAEAIADLVAAETEAQAELALAQMGGSLRDLYESWRAQLLRLLAYLEAAIDFVDEEDVPPELLRDTQQKISALAQEFVHHLDDKHLGERLRDGFNVAVLGAPNAGKSSLVNALAKREVAIVSDLAGTTRDALEVHLNIGGYPVVLIDTAGLRETSDTIESEGIKRARARATAADLKLALFASDAQPDAETQNLVDDKTIIVKTKNDLSTNDFNFPALAISTQTGDGIDRLLQTIATQLEQMIGPVSRDVPLPTRVRHREAVSEAYNYLQHAQTNPVPELLAEDLRLATRALGRLTGRVDVEDLLDVIFRDFCIGK